jgi:replicative DNA helicase
MTKNDRVVDFDDLIEDAEEVADRPDIQVIEETILVGLLAPTLAPNILELTRPGDFHFLEHRIFAQVVYSLLREGAHVDDVTLRRRAEAVEVDDKEVDKLLEFAEKVRAKADNDPPPPGRVESYLDLFVDDVRLRVARAALAKTDQAFTKGDLTAAQVGAEIDRIASDLDVGGRIAGASMTEGEELEAFFAALEARQAPEHDFQGLDTGFPHLNRVINGLGAGLVILAASPSTGKTTFAKQVADQVVEGNKDAACLFVSLEQSKEELRIKTISRLSGVENRDIQRGRLDPTSEAWEKIVEGKEEFSVFADRMLILEGNRSTTADRIRLAARRLRHKTQVARLLIVVDYLHILPTDEDFKDIRQKVNFVTSELRRIGRDLDCPVLAISSINRASYEKGKPGLDVFKESGDIEFSADVALVMTEDKDKKKGDSNYLGVMRKWKRVNLDVVKNRNGERARIGLEFYPEVSRFREVDKNELPEG